jgi:hypothetical protein
MHELLGYSVGGRRRGKTAGSNDTGLDVGTQGAYTDEEAT